MRTLGLPPGVLPFRRGSGWISPGHGGVDWWGLVYPES